MSTVNAGRAVVDVSGAEITTDGGRTAHGGTKSLSDAVRNAAEAAER